MYNLVSALGKSKEYNGRWSSVDISDISMVQLYHDYIQVIVTLTSNFAPTVKLSLDLDELKSGNLSATYTFSEFLTLNGNAALPTFLDTYVLETKYAKYVDAFKAHYKVVPVGPEGHVDSPVPMLDRDWLSLTRSVETYPDFDYDFFQKNCLISVNGMIHLADSDGEQLLVIDGAKSARIANKNQIGIISFREVGELNFIPITEAMVHRRYADVPLSKALYIDIGTSVLNKTAMLVLGGYLIVLDSTTFYRLSDDIYVINLENYPLLERYYESKESIDLSSLGLDASIENEHMVNRNQLYSDEVLTKYATLSQSFIVFVDSEDVFVEKQALPRSRLPGKFTSPVAPVWPLVVGCGAIGDYWSVKEDGQWALTVTKNWQVNYLFNTTLRSNINNVDDAREASNPLDIGRGHFLKIGTDIRKIVGV